MVRAPSNRFFGWLMSARRLLTLIALGDQELLHVFRQVEWTTGAAVALVGFSLMLVVCVSMAMVVGSGDGLTYGVQR